MPELRGMVTMGMLSPIEAMISALVMPYPTLTNVSMHGESAGKAILTLLNFNTAGVAGTTPTQRLPNGSSLVGGEGVGGAQVIS